MELVITSDKLEGGLGHLKLTGEVDVYTSPKLRSAILEHFDSGTESLAIDLSAVDYLDSSGLGVLVAGLKRGKERSGEVILVGPKPRIARVLEVTGLDKVFTILPNMDEVKKQRERK